MYRHTQTAYVVLAVVVLLVTIPVAITLVAPPTHGIGFTRTIALATLLIVFACGVIFSRMSITVLRDDLSWHFGFGLFRKSVPLTEITHVESTRTTLLDGLGIHLTDRGWLYNVSGFEAVWIRLASGRQFLLGSDEPQRLVEAIEAARSDRLSSLERGA